VHLRSSLPLALSFCLVFSFGQAPAHTVVSRRSADNAGGSANETRGAQLPVTHVSLYKNGVGFFEHAGRVTGDEAVTINLTSSQLNDVLQSLTAIDLNGGRITGASYNSTPRWISS
jgi:hypothetical protein